MLFLLSLKTVAMLFGYALPGFLFVKTKLLKEENIVVIAKILTYLCQPFLVLYSFFRGIETVRAGYVEKSELLGFMGIVFVLSLVTMGLFMLLFYLVLRPRYDHVEPRIFTIATTCTNCGFFGVPLLEALFPDHPEAVVYSTILSLILNIMMWTVCSAIITRDRRYMSPKNVFLNPVSIATVLGLCAFAFSFVFPDPIDSMVTLLGQLATPLCMILIGMRLALTSVRDFTAHLRSYAILLVKNLLMPLAAFGLVYFLPIPPSIKQAFVILCACPCASMVLSFAELLGKGQKNAVCLVLISTVGTIVTIPLIALLLPTLA